MKEIIDIYKKYKEVFWQLAYREIKARYKQSVLGYAWAVIVPLLNLLVLSVVFSNLFRVPTGGIPYPVFLFAALVPWTFLSNAITTATGSIISNASLVTKVYLPREIFPLAAIASKSIDLLLTCLVLVIFLFFYGVSFKLTMLLVPIIFLVQLILIIGVSLILSAANVFFRDIENIQSVFLTIWMYLTPIIYSTEQIPESLKPLFYLNPMTGIINAYRDAILFGKFPVNLPFIYSSIFSLFILAFGFYFFRKNSKYFADVI
ncbi:MAG: ABC-transporter involved in LPS biosynthesis Wzm [uncultured bacterium]|uniref:Transport permease protein n=2 Tax=Candidatus Daviesiibacteriota TaxID=1752718 RepID=A0A0G0H7X2_9BACT|nr:MAG: ABC-transporter involved in LPS biosynthesis Wzm [uncultured bacterium]KKQ08174.1 MAG: ABC-type polysaccharide/polyol phosphate export system, permease component [Candidatus Daviesbacteria bacterium GW2011_GWB1_36_5]KKQ15636.1 MAG: ABC-type polysaccharide/polyol phosphate export system, permease component [Candidatus Daviesbacteria bacterium GW2011_GWA1_36_8]